MPKANEYERKALREAVRLLMETEETQAEISKKTGLPENIISAINNGEICKINENKFRDMFKYYPVRKTNKEEAEMMDKTIDFLKAKYDLKMKELKELEKKEKARKKKYKIKD